MKPVTAKLESFFHYVQGDDFCAHFPGGLNDGHPNGTGADHQDRFSFLDLSAPYGMSADGEAFCHDQMVKIEFFGFQEVIEGHAQIFGHSSIPLDAEKVEPGTTIRLSHSASDAVSAFEIRDDSHAITLFKPVRVFPYLSHLA
jgi:gamma-glutamylcysteine synthetase